MTFATTRKLTTALGLGAVVLSVTGQTADASTITWARPRTIADETDLSTKGTLVHAGSWGSTGTVNVEVGEETIAFGDLSARNDNDNGGTILFTGFDSEASNDTFFDAAGTGVGTDLEAILDGFAFQPGPATSEKKVTLLGLDPGKIYQLQVMVSDDRVGAQTIQLSDTSNESQTEPTEGNLSLSVRLKDSPIFTGVFLANDISQDFFFFGPSTNLRSISAYQLRDLSGVDDDPSLLGDFNGDLVVNIADYTLWRNNLGSTFDLAGNGDELGASRGVVDEGDYLLWKESFGQNLLEPQLHAARVPEPAAVWLCGLGAMLLVRRPRAKKARSAYRDSSYRWSCRRSQTPAKEFHSIADKFHLPWPRQIRCQRSQLPYLASPPCCQAKTCHRE